jgi:hypothetical protein
MKDLRSILLHSGGAGRVGQVTDEQRLQQMIDELRQVASRCD